MNKAIFLDRDGVINELVERDGRMVAPWRVEDFKLKPGIAKFISAYREQYKVIVVTNQPDIATGRTTWDTLNAMHAMMPEVDDIMVCPHVDADGCDCRKPKAGMLLAAAKKHDIDMNRSIMFGDGETDMQAARAAGCQGHLCG